MASAAKTRSFEKNPANITSIVAQELDSMSNSDRSPIVFLITSDISEQESLKLLVARQGWRFERFESARELLGRLRPLVPSCIILSLSSELNGLEEQKAIVRERSGIPIIIISRYADIPTIVEAMRAGAVDFFVRPFSDEALLRRVRATIERSRVALQREMEISDLRNCYASLTLRERQVMGLVVSGLLNKQVGGELGISEITVKAHRRQVMQKMKADSLPHLVRMESALEPPRNAIRLISQSPGVGRYWLRARTENDYGTSRENSPLGLLKFSTRN
jgi:FixJ family two-component response regulator